jgi:hypothetical protein
MDKHHAEKTARTIEAYWKAQGYDVTARVVKEAEVVVGREGSPTEWTVRIEPPLKNGVPEGARATTARTILRAFNRSQSDWRKFDDDQPL